MAVIGGLFALALKRMDRKMTRVDKKITTNHGKDAWEYLEMIEAHKDDFERFKVQWTEYVQLRERDAELTHRRLDLLERKMFGSTVGVGD